VMLATLLADVERYDDAAKEAERALETDASSLDALAALAAVRHLQGNSSAFDDARRRALARNPRDADLYVTAAELSARNRLYRDAADLARQALALDPNSPKALGVLGMNQLRLGAADSARVTLDRSFKGDPYNVWVKNTLDLLDNLRSYRESRSARFQFLMDGKEADLLSLDAGALAEEAYDSLAARYGYRAEPPIRLEIYSNHADFSVRTVGLAGLGALGVSFGRTLAMDSPSARKLGVAVAPQLGRARCSS
jgi:tetratricopeptide (TPR) repeat protein